MINTKQNIFTWKIGGAAGQGQQVAGLIFAKMCVRGGFEVFSYSEYPSLIRGGHVTNQVSVSDMPVYGAYQTVNLLVALNKETLDMHLDELNTQAFVMYNSDKIIPRHKKLENHILHALPLETLAKNNSIGEISQNMIALGASISLLKFNLKIANNTVRDMFSQKGPAVVSQNLKAIKIGYDYSNKNFNPDSFHYQLECSHEARPKNVLTANDALSLGVVAAGCKMYIAYPMTPSSSVLHNLAEWAEKFGMIVKHAEDEVGVINMTVGANWAGVRAMCGTSGGGFALMNEAFALAGITETPLVVLESQRPGPATGLPTWTSQSDLAWLTRSGHGEFLGVILAPGDAREAFEQAPLAFNLAEKYQIPVIILLDKYLSESQQSFGDENFQTKNIKIERGKLLTPEKLLKMKNYLRYKVTEDGVSPRSIPGQKNGVSLVNSDEHSERGYSLEAFDEAPVKAQIDKRMRKLPAVLKELPRPEIFGTRKAKTTLIGWGSVKAPVLEAMKYLPKMNYIHVPCPWPLNVHALREVMKTIKIKKLVAIENNYYGQFADILKQHGIEVAEHWNKYSGRQFWPEEIVKKFNSG